MIVGAVTLGTIAAICAISAALSGGIVGMVFRAAAAAWKTERDAALDKAERLEIESERQAGEIVTLKAKVADLEKKTDYEVYAERSARDHAAILDAIKEQQRASLEQTKQLHANTVAVEFLIKQAFPNASLAFPIEDHERSTP